MILNYQAQSLQGTLTVPGDKSISHRGIMFGAIANGTTQLRGFLNGEDCLSTIHLFKQLGVAIEHNDQLVTIKGVGFSGLKPAVSAIDVGNSGTTMRLCLGILAGLPATTRLFGDASLNKRPMKRVMEPLSLMGAKTSGNNNSEYPPITITGSHDLQAIDYRMPVASAQVKSAILLAGLQAQGTTIITEKQVSRNHTEEMIRQFGGEVTSQAGSLYLPGRQQLSGQVLTIPGDISSAAFFIVAALLVPNSQVVLKNVGLNPTRTGLLSVVESMGGDIEILPDPNQTLERGTIIVRTSQLQGIRIAGDIIPRLIDELPIIALLATQAEGTTVIADAEELKVKETNRIDATATELQKLGARITPTTDGMIIEGKTSLQGGKVTSYGDHRIGMMLAIASLIVEQGVVDLAGAEAINVSYPNFFQHLASLVGD